MITLFAYLVFSTALLRLDVRLLASPLACLRIQLLLFYWWLWRVWNLYLYYFQNCIVFLYAYRSPVSVPSFCIRTDLMYQYYFLVFIPIPCIGTFFLYCDTIVIFTVLIIWHVITWSLTPACYHMTPVWYHLSPVTRYITTWLMIIIFQKSCHAILYYIQWLVSLVLMYSY